MTSRTTPRFWAAYRTLPPDTRELARKAYRLFRENARHPSLQFKKVHAQEPIYSVRVALAYRAVGVLKDDEITWFWIGSHADYDRLLESLQWGPAPLGPHEGAVMTPKARLSVEARPSISPAISTVRSFSNKQAPRPRVN